MTVKKKQAKTHMSAASSDIVYGGLDQMVGILLQRAHYSGFKKFSQEMGPEFKPGFYTALSLLEKNPGLSQKSLAQELRRDTSTLVPFLDKMEKRGWLVRKRSEIDRRLHELYITPEGADAARRFDKKVKAIERDIERRMGADDNRKLKELLAKFDEVYGRE
jgi:DNA-binding MarR family transcriptional regulator